MARDAAHRECVLIVYLGHQQPTAPGAALRGRDRTAREQAVSHRRVAQVDETGRPQPQWREDSALCLNVEAKPRRPLERPRKQDEPEIAVDRLGARRIHERLLGHGTQDHLPRRRGWQDRVRLRRRHQRVERSVRGQTGCVTQQVADGHR